MSADKLEMFRNRLTKVNKHISKLMRRQGISCYRIYDHDLPEFPFCIEIYGDQLYLAEYKRRHGMDEEAHEQWLNAALQVMSEVLNKSVDTINMRERIRKQGRQGQYQRVREIENFFVVEEAGLKFKVNLSDYLDSGLFLDHRITRSMVRTEAKDKKVLNLFCYTGSFSVYAAAGGASEVWSVDLSNTYLSWAEDNFRLNGLEDPAKYKFIRADVKQYLDELTPGYFDLIVMDPPTFSNSKMMKDFLDIQRDHVDLLNKALRTMREGGRLYFSTNYRKFAIDKDNIHASRIEDITGKTTPPDFQGKLFRYCYLLTK